jgi:hypothetical protein
LSTTNIRDEPDDSFVLCLAIDDHYCPEYQSPVSPQTVVVANHNHNTDFSSGFPRTVVIVNCQTQYETIVWFVTNITSVLRRARMADIVIGDIFDYFCSL